MPAVTHRGGKMERVSGSVYPYTIKKGKDLQGRAKVNMRAYYVSYRYIDNYTGKWKQTIKRGFVTKSNAQTFLLELQFGKDYNAFSSSGSLLVRNYLGEWLEAYAKINLRENTYIGYARIIEKHLIPHLGNVKLKELSSRHIDKMYSYLLQQGRADGKGGLSAKTVLYTHRVLNEALEHAVKKQLINRNPIKEVTNKPKPKRFRSNIYSAEEIANLLALIKNSPYEVPVALAAICGLRRGECLALGEKDIDATNGIIRINKQLLEVKNKAVFGEPKSEESNRKISAPKEVFDMIERQIVKNKENKRLLDHEYENNNLIVCQENGKPIRPVYFSKNFSKMITRNKLKPIRFHDLRHSCASIMLTSGVAMKTASQILGHSTIGITADLYMHVTDSNLKQAAQQVRDEIFGKNYSKGI